MPVSVERIGVAGVTTAFVAMTAVHLLAHVAAVVVGVQESSQSVRLTYVLGASLVAMLPVWRYTRVRMSGLIGAAVGVAGAIILKLWSGVFDADAAALLVVTPTAFATERWLADWLPETLDGTLRRRPLRSGLWGTMGLVAVVQIARLSTYIADPNFNWWLTTDHPFWARHACMTAYVYGAELQMRGELNLYHAEHYPGLCREAEPHTCVAGLTVEDPYQYPPQFLLLPRLALALTHDFETIQITWFVIQVLGFAAAGLMLARRVGGAAGATITLLMPLVYASIPALYNFQYGQFHLPTIVLAVLGMLAVESRRNVLGGGLLAAAILAKIFPAFLIVPLVLRGRWKAVGWTVAFGCGITLLALVVLGPTPFEAFWHYHLPRLQSGAAFAFEDAWPGS